MSVIGARLTYILEQEGIKAEPAALRLIATAADGSLRDALSLLDQLLAFGGAREVREADARNMLGTVDRQQVVQLARLLAAQDMGGLLDAARALEQWSPDYLQMLDELTSLLARVALFQAVGKPYDDEDDVPAEVMAELASNIQPEDLQLYYQVGLLGRRDLPFTTDQRSGFALTLVRMLAFRPGQWQCGCCGFCAAGFRWVERGCGSGCSGIISGVGSGCAGRATGRTACCCRRPRIAADGCQLGGDCRTARTHRHGAAAGRQLRLCKPAGRQIRLLLDARSQTIRTPGNEQKLTAALASHVGDRCAC